MKANDYGKNGCEKTDYEIIKQCLDGKQEAFSEIVTRYRKLIYSIVYNILRDKQEVNDVAQEVFIRLYKNLDKYNPEYKFSTWAVRITTNLCLDILRKKKAEVLPVEEIGTLNGDFDTPEDRFLDKERNRIVMKAVDELPDKYRIPIILFHQKGLSYEEMCRVLNEPMSIIKNRLYRARLMLREKLRSERQEGIL